MVLQARRGPFLAIALLSLAAAGCSTKTTAMPRWSATSVDCGQGSISLYVRHRWVASSDPRGAVVKTPEGGRANVRVFNCGQPVSEVKRLIRDKLRERLVSSQTDEHSKRVFLFRWREQDAGSLTMSTAVQVHGPLLIAVTSSTIPMDDLARMAERSQLGLPVPLIPGCLPVCLEGARCEPRSSEED